MPSTKNRGVTPAYEIPAYTCTFFTFFIVGKIGLSPCLHHIAVCLPVGWYPKWKYFESVNITFFQFIPTNLRAKSTLRCLCYSVNSGFFVAFAYLNGSLPNLVALCIVLLLTLIVRLLFICKRFLISFNDNLSFINASLTHLTCRLASLRGRPAEEEGATGERDDFQW